MFGVLDAMSNFIHPVGLPIIDCSNHHHLPPIYGVRGSLLCRMFPEQTDLLRNKHTRCDANIHFLSFFFLVSKGKCALVLI